MNVPPHEAIPTNTEANIAVIAVELRYVKEAVERIEKNTGTNVTRNEWEQRNGHVDGRFSQVHGEITAVKTELEARRAPWWSVVAALAAAAALLVTLIPLIAK